MGKLANFFETTTLNKTNLVMTTIFMLGKFLHICDLEKYGIFFSCLVNSKKEIQETTKLTNLSKQQI
jgi:hypothetical protein